MIPGDSPRPRSGVVFKVDSLAVVRQYGHIALKFQSCNNLSNSTPVLFLQPIQYTVVFYTMVHNIPCVPCLCPGTIVSILVEMLIKCNLLQQEQGKQNQLTVVEVIHMSCVKEANKLDTRRSRWNVDVSGR